jgi:hypothetical protein
MRATLAAVAQDRDTFTGERLGLNVSLYKQFHCAPPPFRNWKIFCCMLGLPSLKKKPRSLSGAGFWMVRCR